MICLDILRSLSRDAEAAAALEAELDAAKGVTSVYDRALAVHRERWGGGVEEAEARWFAESAATLLTASVLARYGTPEVAEAYSATRLGAARGRTVGAVALAGEAEILARLAEQG